MAVLAVDDLRKSDGGEIARTLLLGEIPGNVALHALVLLAYAAAGFYAASVLFRRRLLK